METLADYLGALAERSATPGAGSSAAAAVGMAAALTEMAARFSDDEPAAGRAEALRARALQLGDDDAAAYAAVLGSSGEERAAALSRASDVPLAIADAAREVLALVASMVGRGNPNLRGEVLAAAELAEAGARAAATLVLINLGEDSADERAARARVLRGGDPAALGAPATDWSLRRRITLPSGAIAWDSFGDGPAVVLVHGTPTWSYLWRHVAPALAGRFTVYVFDLPGYGASPAPADGAVSIRTHARVLAELLDHWGLDDPAVAGHDIGGATVLRAHLLHGCRFRRIALIDAVVLAPWITQTTRHIQAHLDVYRTMPEHIFDRITAAHLRTAVHVGFDPEVFDAYHARWRGKDGQAAYLNKVARFDEDETREFEPLLGDIGIPALVAWGAEDAWLDPSLAGRLGELIPGARVEMIEGAGHFAMEDAPDEVAHRLLEFFR